MFVVISRRVPSVLVEDSTRAQANARAGWNARRYGVTFGFVSNDDRFLLHNVAEDRKYTVANTCCNGGGCQYCVGQQGVDWN
jgi:hypothetical protein